MEEKWQKGMVSFARTNGETGSRSTVKFSDGETVSWNSTPPKRCKDGEHVWDAMSEWCTTCGISVEEIVQWPAMPSWLFVNSIPSSWKPYADTEVFFFLCLDLNVDCADFYYVYIGF